MIGGIDRSLGGWRGPWGWDRGCHRRRGGERRGCGRGGFCLRTAFQQQVWAALRDIPPGTTATYGEIARRIGKPAAVRAVGTACAANQIAVAIPCHRVVGSDGKLTGYRWGVQRKRALLDREKEKA